MCCPYISPSTAPNGKGVRREGDEEREGGSVSLLRFRDLDSLIPLLCIRQPDGWMDVWLNKWMDGLSWRREGRAGWREVVPEMEEKKMGNINLAEGRPTCLSLSVSPCLETHMYTHTRETHLHKTLSGPFCQSRQARCTTSRHTRVKEWTHRERPLPQGLKSERFN